MRTLLLTALPACLICAAAPLAFANGGGAVPSLSPPAPRVATPQQ
jgi:hypothetical protein